MKKEYVLALTALTNTVAYMVGSLSTRTGVYAFRVLAVVSCVIMVVALTKGITDE